LIVHA